MNRYESYKEVDLPWLKEVPSHWEVSKIKRISCYDTGNSIKDTEKDKYTIENQSIKYISTSDINKEFSKIYHKCGLFIPKTQKTFKIAKKNSTLVCIEGGSGGEKVALIEEDVCYVNKLCSFHTEKMNSKYFFYYFKSNLFKTLYFSHVNGDRNGVSKQNLGLFVITIPQLQEQAQIANYLDWKINEIDRLIAKEKEKIRELNDLKKITVSDIFMSKKENTNKIVSKYEWIGEIPDYYKVYPLKKLCNKIIDGTHQTPQYTSEGVPFLRVTDISKLEYGESIDWNNVAFISDKEHKELYKRCNPEKNDVLVSKNGTIGIPKIVDWNEEVSIFVSLCLLKINNLVLSEWIYYYFLTYLTEREISYGGKTGTITNLHLNKIREFKIPVPNLVKQKEIVKKINMETNKINNLINKTNQQIQNLESLKQSLISEVVTGQIDVRDVVIPEYEKFTLEVDAKLEGEVEEDA